MKKALLMAMFACVLYQVYPCYPNSDSDSDYSDSTEVPRVHLLDTMAKLPGPDFTRQTEHPYEESDDLPHGTMDLGRSNPFASMPFPVGAHGGIRAPSGSAYTSSLVKWLLNNALMRVFAWETQSDGYTRRLVVEKGLVFGVGLLDTMGPDDSSRRWLNNHVMKLYAGTFDGQKTMEYVAFEAGTRIRCLGAYAFRRSGLKNICIPDSIELVRNSCFELCASLKSVTFGAGSKLRLFGNYSFSVSALESIRIPASVRVIGDHCFVLCTSLESGIFESDSHLTHIGEGAFAHSALRSMCVPATVEYLGDGCFGLCSFLETIDFEPGSCLWHIGCTVFRDCAARCIILPGSVKFIGGGNLVGYDDGSVNLGFEFESRWLQILLLDGVPVLRSIDGTKLASVTSKPSVKTFVVRRIVESLEQHCFARVKFNNIYFESQSRIRELPEYAFSFSELYSICIPASVIKIAAWCFACCCSLSSLTFEDGSELRYIHSNALSGCPKLEPILIPWSVTCIDCVRWKARRTDVDGAFCLLIGRTRGCGEIDRVSASTHTLVIQYDTI
jgi:hypothetical protein